MKRPRSKVCALVLAAAAAVGALAAGCGNDDSPAAPNQPPQTTLVPNPSDSSRVAHHVTFYFSGADYDGTVREFDYILTTYPRSVATIGQIQLQVPQRDDPRWQRIQAYQLNLVLQADTLRADPQGDIGAGEFDRWHSFFLRAVDNEGAIDETPEGVTLQAFTVAPALRLQSPVRAAQTVTLPRTLVMNWDGIDPIARTDPYQDPQRARWVLLRATLDGSGRPLGFPDSLYALTESRWSPWAAWVAADSSGREAVLRDLLAAGPTRQAFVFAVQGQDDGGAITPQFDASDPESNNYAAFVVDGSLPEGPRITVHAEQDSLSNWTFDGIGAPQINVPSAPDTVTLYWDPPSAASYGARARETRYGWNIFPSEDDEWTAWSSLRFAPPHVLAAAQEVFYIQARDHIGQVTQGVIVFTRARHRPGR